MFKKKLKEIVYIDSVEKKLSKKIESYIALIYRKTLIST